MNKKTLVPMFNHGLSHAITSTNTVFYFSFRELIPFGKYMFNLTLSGSAQWWRIPLLLSHGMPQPCFPAGVKG